jgi:Cu-Zn family superoxide dismutase
MSARNLKMAFFSSLAVAAGVTVVGCKTDSSSMQAPAAPLLMDEAAVTKAVATIGPSKAATTQPTNNDVTGTVKFTLADGKLTFVADIDGLAPNTEHGFHIHEKGDLSAPDLKSAGGHFNPTKEKHGGPETEHHHAGDLGNLKADDKGHAHLEGTVMHASLSGETSIIGRSVIIHAKPDDLKSDPSGNSGARIAGGEIKAG